MALVVLDRQHTGKPSKMDDTGAYSQIVQEHEAHMVAHYLLEVECTLRALGHSVVPISDGKYSERHRRANALFKEYSGPCVYLAGHLNAGGGSYGALFFDERSAMGEDASAFVAKELKEVLNGMAVKCLASKRSDWTKHAFNTIAGVWSGRGCGICLEPFFLDDPEAKDLMSTDGLVEVGNAIARGIDAWAQAVG
jgi:hypothetical protein